MRLRRRPRPPGLGRAAWPFPAAFALHVLEEAPGCEGLLTRKGLLLASAIGGLIHAAVVARQLFFVELAQVSKRAPA